MRRGAIVASGSQGFSSQSGAQWFVHTEALGRGAEEQRWNRFAEQNIQLPAQVSFYEEQDTGYTFSREVVRKYVRTGLFGSSCLHEI